MPNLKFFTTDANKTPNHPKLMLANIEAIKHLGGSGVAGDIRDFVIKKYQVSKKEQLLAQPSDPRSRLEYYLGWGREYLKRSNDLGIERRLWKLTEQGREIQNIAHTELSLTNAKETIAIEDRARRDARREPVVNAVVDEIPPYDVWKSDLLKIVKDITPSAFERLCQHLLRAKDFINVELSRKGADGGIDGTGILHENLLSRKICFQCKRWKGGIDVTKIRDFRGAIDGRATHGLFITTSYFTDPATKEATRDGAVLIDLIDGDLLCDLLKETSLGVTTSPDGQIITPNPDYFNSI